MRQIYIYSLVERSLRKLNNTRWLRWLTYVGLVIGGFLIGLCDYAINVYHGVPGHWIALTATVQKPDDRLGLVVPFHGVNYLFSTSGLPKGSQLAIWLNYDPRNFHVLSATYWNPLPSTSVSFVRPIVGALIALALVAVFEHVRLMLLVRQLRRQAPSDAQQQVRVEERASAASEPGVPRTPQDLARICEAYPDEPVEVNYRAGPRDQPAHGFALFAQLYLGGQTSIPLGSLSELVVRDRKYWPELAQTIINKGKDLGVVPKNFRGKIRGPAA